MVENVTFSTTSHEKSEYLLNENARIWRELVVVKQWMEHLALENQQLSSQSFNTVE